MNKTRVLACQIDEELRVKMKEHIKNKNITVKNYIIGLITDDLEKNNMLENTKTDTEKIEEGENKDTKIKSDLTNKKKEDIKQVTKEKIRETKNKKAKKEKQSTTKNTENNKQNIKNNVVKLNNKIQED